jgi:DNA (cytosine-5)-methyltransferase 1
LAFLDLFSGCGGFSLGLEEAGLKCIAAIDSDPAAMEVFRSNHARGTHALCRDLTKFRPRDLDKMLDGERIDVIVGGPPCQGFSQARQVDGANHGSRLVHDNRRFLYREFLRYVQYFQPQAFVMENVLGIRSAAGGEFFTKVHAEARKLGYRVVAHAVEAWRYGVPQKRVRQLIIGTRRELPLFIPGRHLRPTHGDQSEDRNLEPLVSLWEAIGDLPPLEAGTGTYVSEYDPVLRALHLAQYGNRYLRGVLRVHEAKSLTSHVARPHNERDLRDFDRLREGEHSRQAIDRGELMEFPYDRGNFKDRFTRQHRNRLCSTIVAHLSKDGLMFIHPTQRRSLTVREGARIQSFPDTFLLPESRSAAFRVIGNAVPPLLGKAIGVGLKQYFKECEEIFSPSSRALGLLPRDKRSALKLLETIVVGASRSTLKELPHGEFIAAWWAVGFLLPDLHPDAVEERRGDISSLSRGARGTALARTYKRSGWPVELVSLAKEAKRRLLAGEISEDDYYCSLAVVAGAAAT